MEFVENVITKFCFVPNLKIFRKCQVLILLIFLIFRLSTFVGGKRFKMRRL